MRRREILGGSLALTGIGSFAGCLGQRYPDSEQYGIQFGTVVDAVDDLEMDPSGNSSIDTTLQKSIERGNELVAFPPGEYRVTEGVTTDSVNNWGLVGLGSDPGDVRFIYTSSEGIIFITTDGGDGQLIKNVTIDYNQQKNGTVGIVLRGNDNLFVVDLQYVGFDPTSSNGDNTNLSVEVFNPDGEALAEGVVRTGPSMIASHASQGPPSNSPFFWLGGRHRGTLKINNWHIENTGGNAIYASRTNGTVQVEDSTFVNNNQSSVRISGDDCYCRNCSFVIDTDNDHPDNEYAEGDYINPNAVMWESGDRSNSGALIKGCEFIYRSRPDNSRTLRAVRGLGNIGDFEVRDTRFLLDTADTMAIYAEDPENPSFGSTASKPWNVTVESVRITGSADAHHGAIELNNRSQSVITNSCLQLSGKRDGIVITDSQDCRVEDTNIDVGGQKIVSFNSDVTTTNLTTDKSCPDSNTIV